MHVLVLSHLYPNPLQPLKGLFVWQQVRALHRAGIRVEVISPLPWVPPLLGRLRARWRAFQEAPRSQDTESGPVSYPRFFTLPGARWRPREGASIARATAPLLRGREFDLIHAHTAVPDGDAARRLSRQFGRPFVCTVHGYDFVWLRQPGATREAILATFREAAQVICVSERVRQGCLEHDPRPEHFRVIHHGVDVPADDESTEELLPGRRLVLGVGNLTRQKGFADLVRAFSQVAPEVPDVHLVIAGSGPERARLERLAAAGGVADRLLLLGAVPHAELLALYRQADVFCLPSHDEGFGLVYLEAMARGVPVIGSRGEGVADIVVSGINGLLVDPGDQAALCDALRLLLRDEETRRRLGEAGQRTVETRLTWERNAWAHARCYARVRGPRPAPDKAGDS